MPMPFWKPKYFDHIFQRFQQKKKKWEKCFNRFNPVERQLGGIYFLFFLIFDNYYILFPYNPLARTFLVIITILYPLKTPENQRCFEGV